MYYISGYISSKIIKTLKCLECLHLLLDTSKDHDYCSMEFYKLFQTTVDRGKLTSPSNTVYKIIVECERTFQLYLVTEHLRMKNITKIMTRDVQKTFFENDIMNYHYPNTHPIIVEFGKQTGTDA